MKKNKPYHTPVLTEEVLTYLAPKPGKIYVDATFGGGGHTQAILDAEPDCSVIALDWDLRALEENGLPLQEKYPDRLMLVWGNFAQIEHKLKKVKVKAVDGILADFGTSMEQLTQRPGFSFATDTLLDMRMSPSYQKITAADVLNQANERTLIQLFKEYGQEPKARALTMLIVQERSEKPIKTTFQLVKLVERLHGPKAGRKIHPATKVFQALRIYVNQELDNIKAFLPAAMRILNVGGRLVCISFHSLEDRLVKQFFKEQITKKEGNRALILTPKAIVATPEEIAKNSSSRSAKLRALEIIDK